MTTLKTVQRNVLSGRWTQRFVLPPDRAVYRSPIWEFFKVIYDENLRVVKQFFVCSNCGIILNYNLNTHGNSQLKRHRCYVDYVKQQEDDGDDDDDDEDDDGEVFLPIDDGGEENDDDDVDDESEVHGQNTRPPALEDVDEIINENRDERKTSNKKKGQNGHRGGNTNVRGENIRPPALDESGKSSTVRNAVQKSRKRVSIKNVDEIIDDIPAKLRITNKKQSTVALVQKTRSPAVSPARTRSRALAQRPRTPNAAVTSAGDGTRIAAKGKKVAKSDDNLPGKYVRTPSRTNSNDNDDHDDEPSVVGATKAKAKRERNDDDVEQPSHGLPPNKQRKKADKPKQNARKHSGAGNPVKKPRGPRPAIVLPKVKKEANKKGGENNIQLDVASNSDIAEDDHRRRSLRSSEKN